MWFKCKCYLFLHNAKPVSNSFSQPLITLLVLSCCLHQISAQWTQLTEEGGEGKVHPVVNKCCPLHQRYENGSCMDTGQRMMSEDKLWEPPQTMFYDPDIQQVSDHPVIFQLRLIEPNCTAGVIEKIISGKQPWLQQDSNTSSFNDTDGELVETHAEVVLSPEGSLIWIDENYHTNHQYENFCLDQVNKSTYIAKICKPLCNDEKPCVRKCCEPGAILDIRNETCIPVHTPWTPNISSSTLKHMRPGSPLHFMVGVPPCDLFMIDMRKPKNNERFFVLSNGSIVTVDGDDHHLYTTEYCVDGVADESNEGEYKGQNIYEKTWHSGRESDQIALICLPTVVNEEENMPWIYPLFAGVMFISAIFLVLTAAVYLILWEYQNIHGWLQFSYVVSLLFAFLFLAFVQLFSQFLLDDYPELCEFFGSVIHFSFLSAFFWLTSMNFDLWWTFSGCRPLRASTRTGEKKRFAFFALLSWGSALVISSTGVALDSIYKNNEVISKFLPLFGQKNCYFHNEWAKLPFFYAPISFLLFVNVIFFLSTILSLHKLQKDTRFATRQSSKQDKKRFVLFLKLFVLMGVCWIFEMISWVSAVLSPHQEDTLRLAFLTTDIINALQGVFIFIIFTCKPNTCKNLEGQFKKLSVRLEEARDKTGRSHSQSKISQYCAVGFCSVILPIVHALRKLFSYCGRPTRSLEGRRTISHNTVTSTFEKSRKASDSSACTTLSVIDGGAYEMDTTY